MRIAGLGDAINDAAVVTEVALTDDSALFRGHR
jgi:hypothetical protein